MGNAKWTEEIQERFLSNGDVSTNFGTSANRSMPRPVRPLRFCPLCFESYIDAKLLQTHIARVHGKEHVYLVVNDAVVRDVCWLRGSIRKCEIVMLEMPEVEVIIRLGDGDVAGFRANSTTSLKERITTGFEGRISIRVNGGPRTREFTIYLGRQPDFRSDKLDDPIRSIQNRLQRDEIEDLSCFFENHRRLASNDLELRYLRGFDAYSHGMLMEKQGKFIQVRQRMESAMDLLLPFRTAMADFARCVLSLRMNCFSALAASDPASRFGLAKAFYLEGKTEEIQGWKGEFSTGDDVYIDKGTRLVLDTLEAFYSGNHKRVLDHLDFMHASGLIRDRNDEDKWTLIEARTCRRSGDMTRASIAFARLKNHPFFGLEAAGFSG